MTTYLAVTMDGRTRQFSAFTYSEAYQQANDWAGSGQLRSFDVT